MASLSGFRRPARALLGLALLVVPAVGVTWASRALSDGLAAQAGAALSQAAEAAFARPAPEASAAPSAEPAASAAPEAAPVAEKSLSSKRSPAPAPKAAPPKGVLVREALVERAVRSGQRPSGNPVAAAGARPAGVSLAGVSGFGSGLRDGDIVTQVGGLATPSVEAVIIAVAGAVRSGATALSAVVWRGDSSFPVTVEIPDLGQRGGKRAAAAPKTPPKPAPLPREKRAHGDAVVGDRERAPEGRGAGVPRRESQ